MRAVGEVILSQAVPWRQTLVALAARVPESDALPAAAGCPLCQGRMVVYPDVRAGVWCHCGSCGWVGDLIELSSRVWGLDLPAALRKLAACGVCLSPRTQDLAAVERYRAGVVAYRLGIRDFCDASTRFPFQDSATLRRLHDQFGLYSLDNADRWRTQLGGMVLGTTKTLASRAVRPNANPSDIYLFKGTGWDDLLTLSFQDVPGRACGFWFCGRQGAWPDDWLYHRIERYHGFQANTPPDERETGLAFLEAVAAHSPYFGDTAFVLCNQPQAALTLHGRHFRDHGDLLPVGLTYEGPRGVARHIWRCLPNKELVFWSPRPTREVFAQARAAGGRVALGPFDPQEEGRSHLAWLRRLRERARPWQEALAEAMERMSDSEVEDILLYLELSHVDAWKALVDRVPDEARPRLEALRTRHWPYKVIRMGPHQRLSERPEGWVMEDTGELVSDVTVRLQYAVRRKEQGGSTESYYYGYFTHKGRKWKLRGSTRHLRRHLAAEIEHRLIASGAGVPCYSPGWKYRLLDIALKFHKPKLARARPRPDEYPDIRASTTAAELSTGNGGDDSPANETPHR